eukprot:6056201-Pyramimonas_sp.AAC.1
MDPKCLYSLTTRHSMPGTPGRAKAGRSPTIASALAARAPLPLHMMRASDLRGFQFSCMSCLAK